MRNTITVLPHNPISSRHTMTSITSTLHTAVNTHTQTHTTYTLISSGSKPRTVAHYCPQVANPGTIRTTSPDNRGSSWLLKSQKFKCCHNMENRSNKYTLRSDPTSPFDQKSCIPRTLGTNALSTMQENCRVMFAYYKSVKLCN